MRIEHTANCFWKVFVERAGVFEWAGVVTGSGSLYWAHPVRYGIGEPMILDSYPIQFSSVQEAAGALS